MAATTSHHDAGAAVATAPVTVEQAAAILGVSASTIRRRIRDGSLRAQPAHRPQGVVWLVHLPAAATVGTTQPPPPAGAVATTPTAAAGDQMIAYTRSLLEPLVAALERSQGRVAELERENGQLAAELRALQAPQDAQEGTQEGRTAAEAPDPTTEPSAPPAELPEPLAPDPRPPATDGRSPWWRRWWPAFAAAILALVTSGASCQVFGPG